MRFTVCAVVATLGVVVSAQSIQSLVAQFPTCVLPCMASAAMQIGCGVMDITCQCSKHEELQEAVTPCLTAETSTCEMEDLLNFLDLATEACTLALEGSSPGVAESVEEKQQAAPSASTISSSSSAATVSSSSSTADSSVMPTVTLAPAASSLTVLSSTSTSSVAEPTATGAAVTVNIAKGAVLAAGVAVAGLVL